MNKKYVVRLSDSERDVCQEIIKNLKLDFRTFTGVVCDTKRADHHARIRYPGVA